MCEERALAELATESVAREGIVVRRHRERRAHPLLNVAYAAQNLAARFARELCLTRDFLQLVTEIRDLRPTVNPVYGRPMSTRRTLFRRVLPVVLLGAMSGCFSCGPCACPAARASFVVESPDGGFVPNDVTAFVVELGQPSGQLGCVTAGHTTGPLVCAWFGILSVDAGSYTIQVAAPGFQTVNVPVALSVSQPIPGKCGCGGGTLSPNSVVLTPGDGGP